MSPENQWSEDVFPIEGVNSFVFGGVGCTYLIIYWSYEETHSKHSWRVDFMLANAPLENSGSMEGLAQFGRPKEECHGGDGPASWVRLSHHPRFMSKF